MKDEITRADLPGLLLVQRRMASCIIPDGQGLLGRLIAKAQAAPDEAVACMNNQTGTVTVRGTIPPDAFDRLLKLSIPLYTHPAPSHPSGLVPEGWRIERSGDRIIVQQMQIGAGYAAARDGESGIAESVLYLLGESLLAAAPQTAPQQGDEALRLREPTTAMVQAACAAFRMDISPMQAMHEALCAALSAQGVGERT